MEKTIKVKRNDVKRFMEEVKPVATINVELNGDSYDITFTNDEEYRTAEKWFYINYGEKITDDSGKEIGFIDYNFGCGYCYTCYADNHEEYGFKNPDKAIDALLEYYHSN